NVGNHDAQLLIAMAPGSLWKHAGEAASNGTSTPVQGERLATETIAPPHGQQVEDCSNPNYQQFFGLMQRVTSPQEASRRLLSYAQVKERPKLLLAMTGLTPAEFEQLCRDFEKAWNEFVRQNSSERAGRQRQYRGGKSETTL